MSIISDFLGFSSEMMNDGTGNIIDLNDFCYNVEVASYHRLAIEIAIDLIGNAVARVDWNVFKKNILQQNIVTTTLNGQPNALQTSSEFFKLMTRKLLLRGEVLIVEINNELFVADCYESEQTKYNEVTYSDIQINGKDTPKKKYKNNEVIFMKYGDTVLAAYLESYMQLMNPLTSSAVESFKSNRTRRFVISSDDYRANLTEVQENFNKMMEQQLASFIGSKKATAIYAKPKKNDLIDMSDKNFMMSTDARGLISDTFKTVANAFHIPPEYMLGGALSQMIVDNFLVNAVYPIVDMFKEAFNNFQYSQLERQNGTMVKPDTSKSRIVDLKTIGTFIAQVFPTGALTLNDIVTKYLQLDELPEEIGDTRVITKNYSELEQFIEGETHDEVLGEEETLDIEQEENKETTLFSNFKGVK